MNINITFRHMDPSEAIKNYARGKVAKLQKFLRQPMEARVTLSLDKLRHVAETHISSGGSHVEAKEAGDDMYASIDRVSDKLERQLRGAKGLEKTKKRRSGATLRGGDKPQPIDGALGPAKPAKIAKAAKKTSVSPAKKKPTKKKSAADKRAR